MIKTNYHTHTSFCDGADQIESLIQEALKKDFKILGLSSHSMYPFASTWHIPPNDYENYEKTAKDLAKKYENQIQILFGFEADFVPPFSWPDFKIYKRFSPDFLIGSVHYIFTPKGHLCVDYSAEKLKQKIDELFNGNTKKLTQEYFFQEREMIKNCDFTILGHADLIRKNNAKLNLFNENDSWYRNEIKATAKLLSKSNAIVEINTGGMARKTIDCPYPSKEFLSLLCQYKVPVTFSSDCHQKELLDFEMERAIKEAKTAGYTELAYIEKGNNIKFQKI